jgi:hypothetical protein
MNARVIRDRDWARAAWHAFSMFLSRSPMRRRSRKLAMSARTSRTLSSSCCSRLTTMPSVPSAASSISTRSTRFPSCHATWPFNLKPGSNRLILVEFVLLGFDLGAGRALERL